MLAVFHRLNGHLRVKEMGQTEVNHIDIGVLQDLLIIGFHAGDAVGLGRLPCPLRLAVASDDAPGVFHIFQCLEMVF